MPNFGHLPKVTQSLPPNVFLPYTIPHIPSSPETPMLYKPWLMRAGAQPAPGRQSTTPALIPLSLHQTWMACRLQQSSFQPSFPHPLCWSSAPSYGRRVAGSLESPTPDRHPHKVSHSRTTRTESSISVSLLVSLYTTLWNSTITSVLPKAVTYNP